jgi:hypothetical protein
MKKINKVSESQVKIYKDLYNKHKGTTMAVSSESLNHKRLRYKNICMLLEQEEKFSVHDVGMGIADLYAYMLEEFPDKSINYSGTEIVEEFLTETKTRFPEITLFHRDLAEQSFEDSYDFVVMSGVFHQRRDTTIGGWEAFSQNILKNAFAMCTKGIAFNFISPFVDFYQTEVYYANLPKLLNFINDDLSRFFEIKHNYALFEFTVFVYKEEYIKAKYKEPEFQKYFKV